MTREEALDSVKANVENENSVKHMLAAEAILDALINNDFSQARLGNYQKALYGSYIGKELYRVRNFHQAFQKGLWVALVKAGLQYILGGRILKGRLTTKPDFVHLEKVLDAYGTDTPTDDQKGVIKFDGENTFDKETDVYYSGTTHEEQQPAHLKIGDLDICYTSIFSGKVATIS